MIFFPFRLKVRKFVIEYEDLKKKRENGEITRFFDFLRDENFKFKPQISVSTFSFLHLKIYLLKLKDDFNVNLVGQLS